MKSFSEKKKLFQDKFDDLLLFEYFSDVQFVTETFNIVSDLLAENFCIDKVEYVYPDYTHEESLGFVFYISDIKIKVIAPVYGKDKFRIAIDDIEEVVKRENIVDYIIAYIKEI